ncbi:Integrase, catalytic core [Gossypium australe]|uniref:Integrase, catalytic core n=1 Tax=Gossypium australe TaxID=47621 RepID=A0A5B6V4Q1_9ROSI|nr:Integrase, catalytic core [Gossypium australe]
MMKTLTKLKDQMSQLISMIEDIKRQIVTRIPSNIENNPQREGKEHVKAIKLRSCKVLRADVKPESKEVAKPIAEPKDKSIKELAMTRIPFPLRLEENQRRDDDGFVSFLNLFKSFNVNLPLIDLIEKVPKYTKYLKEIMFRCRKVKIREQVNISTSCSVIISKHITSKLKDPGSFTIPIEIRDIHCSKALCDLGTSINLMPLSIYEKFRLGDLKNTQITLQLSNRSSVQPKGVFEDVLVKVRSFIIPMDFVILDFEGNREIPILLGRPLLATSGSTINLENNELTLKINGEIEIFKCGHNQNEENREKLGKPCYELTIVKSN